MGKAEGLLCMAKAGLLIFFEGIKRQAVALCHREIFLEKNPLYEHLQLSEGRVG